MSNSKVQLSSLSVDSRGDIHLSASSSFLEFLRTKFGVSKNHTPGSSLRVGSFDFLEVKKNLLVAVPDERSDRIIREARQLGNAILQMYRSAILFEKVFEKEGSYEKWFTFHHRAPTLVDLQTIAARGNVQVPSMTLPYKASEFEKALNPVLKARIHLDGKKKPLPVISSPELKKFRIITVNKEVSSKMLAALAAKFKR